MSITNGFTPLPNWFIAGASVSNFTNREFKLYYTIGVEIFRFPESREVMSKELSNRFLQSLTGINHSNISRILRKFEKRGLIKIVKSHVKGQGSIIFLLSPGASVTPENKNTAVTITPQNLKSGVTITQNPITQNLKKDLKKDDSDSSLNIEQAIEEKPMENSLNSSPDTKSFLTSSEDSNSEKPVINSLCPPAPTSNVGFTALGSVLPAVPIPDTHKTCSSSKDVDKSYSPVKDTYNVLTLSDKAISTGKTLLLEKGFSSSEIQNITGRITASMTDKDIKSKDKYFIACCSKETRKGNSPASSVHKSTSAILPVQKKNSFTETVNKWEEEKKKDSPEETIKKLMKLSPDDLYRVILDVDSSPAGKFVSLPEIKASLYVAEFKKRYPEVKV